MRLKWKIAIVSKPSDVFGRHRIGFRTFSECLIKLRFCLTEDSTSRGDENTIFVINFFPIECHLIICRQFYLRFVRSERDFHPKKKTTRVSWHRLLIVERLHEPDNHPKMWKFQTAECPRPKGEKINVRFGLFFRRFGLLVRRLQPIINVNWWTASTERWKISWIWK